MSGAYRSEDIFVVSGRKMDVTEVSKFIKNVTLVSLTVLLRSQDTLRKVESQHTVYTAPEYSVSDSSGLNSAEFRDRWPEIKDLILRVAKGDRTVGKEFLRQAMLAYRVKERLRPDQIVEAFAGAFLVNRVNDQ